MKLVEMSLFDLPMDEYMIGHCISSDFGMGAGIVVMFNKLYNMKNVLTSKYRKHTWFGWGYCIKEFNVYNLITKEFVYGKPTYKSLQQSLHMAKLDMMLNGYTKLGLPLIGCGIDGLVWSQVSPIIESVFADTNIEVTICYLESDKHLLEK